MLTPLDIENKKFSKQIMNGYNVEEVDDFLDEIGVDFAKKQKEVNEASKKIEELNASLEHYKNIESTLQNTLLMAQSTAEEVKNIAKQKADQIVTDAKASSLKEVDFIQNQILMKKKELEDVQKQFDIYKAKMESLLISQLELIKEINKNDAQLIFNTHDTNLLSLDNFRRDQIWFTEKDPKKGSTEIYPLDDFSVRKTENVQKGYLNGRYGAIPFLVTGNSLWED